MEETEIKAVNTFAEYIKNYHKDCIISKCGLVLHNGFQPCHKLGQVQIDLQVNVMFML